MTTSQTLGRIQSQNLIFQNVHSILSETVLFPARSSHVATPQGAPLPTNPSAAVSGSKDQNLFCKHKSVLYKEPFRSCVWITFSELEFSCLHAESSISVTISELHLNLIPKS